MIFFHFHFHDSSKDSYAMNLRITISNMQNSSGPRSIMEPLGDQLKPLNNIKAIFNK